MSSSPTPSGATDARRVGPVVPVLAFSGILAAMMQSVITPLISDLPEILDTSASNAAWVVTATLLVGAVCMPIAGRLGDMYGKRRMIVVCTVPLALGSAICALSTALVPMLVGRCLQGMGMGIVALAVSLIREVVSAEKVSASLALVSASLGIGSGLGMPLSAAVSQYANWRVMFWICTALAALAAVAVIKVVPEGKISAKGQTFDGPGAVGLAVGLISLLLGVSKGADWGWTSGATLGSFTVAVVALLVWGWWELRATSPLVDLRTTARPQVLTTNAASLFVGFGMYVSMLVTPQIMMLPTSTGYGLGQSMLACGMWMLPGGLIQVFLSPVGGKLLDLRGPKFTLILGSGIIAVGYVVAMFSMSAAWSLMISHTVVKAGVGIAYGAMPTLIMGGVPRTEVAAANGFNSLMRTLGTSTGAAVIGVVLAQTTVRFGDADLVSQHGARIGYGIGIGVGVVAAAIAVLIPLTRRPKAVDADANRA
ncbi:MFS transporter [Nocardioides yefusunii]|uniref:MFS transporter n=1 Tax=Nocardioides yefusunii TaxID=2500546 RepID=A0ABW1QSS8_9ACTN|nr:MFS transporter [Nocardioides yefusunii]